MISLGGRSACSGTDHGGTTRRVSRGPAWRDRATERFRRWRHDGTIDRILGLWCIDATVVRAGRSANGAELRGKKVVGEPADHTLGRSRGGLGTKLHLVVDGSGIPLAAAVTAGQAHESKSLGAVLESVRLRRPGRGRPRHRPRRLAGDKG